MPTNFPNSVDSLPDPTSTTSPEGDVVVPAHHALHAAENDAIVGVETTLLSGTQGQILAAGANGVPTWVTSATAQSYLGLGSAALQPASAFSTPAQVTAQVTSALTGLGSAALQPASAFSTPAQVTAQVTSALTTQLSSPLPWSSMPFSKVFDPRDPAYGCQGDVVDARLPNTTIEATSNGVTINSTNFTGAPANVLYVFFSPLMPAGGTSINVQTSSGVAQMTYTATSWSQQEWDQGNSYSSGNYVLWRGSCYVATTTTTTGAPPDGSGSSQWTQLTIPNVCALLGVTWVAGATGGTVSTYNSVFQQLLTSSFTVSGSTGTLTDSAANFPSTITSAGKYVWISAAATTGYKTVMCPVTTWNSATSITITAPSGVTLQNSPNCSYFYGTDDTTAWNTMMTAITSNGALLDLRGRKYLLCGKTVAPTQASNLTIQGGGATVLMAPYTGDTIATKPATFFTVSTTNPTNSLRSLSGLVIEQVSSGVATTPVSSNQAALILDQVSASANLENEQAVYNNVFINCFAVLTASGRVSTLSFHDNIVMSTGANGYSVNFMTLWYTYNTNIFNNRLLGLYQHLLVNGAAGGGFTFRNNLVRWNYSPAGTASQSLVSLLETASDTIAITGNVIEHWLIGNTITTAQSSNLIQIGNATTSENKDLLIADNLATDINLTGSGAAVGGHAVYLYSPQNTIVENNVFEFNPNVTLIDCVVELYGGCLDVYMGNNIIRGQGYENIACGSGTFQNLYVYDNTLLGAAFGFYLNSGSGTNVEVVGNKIFVQAGLTSAAGIGFNNGIFGTGSIVKNNIIEGSNSALVPGVFLGPNAQNVVVESNTYIQTTSGGGWVTVDGGANTTQVNQMQYTVVGTPTIPAWTAGNYIPGQVVLNNGLVWTCAQNTTSASAPVYQAYGATPVGGTSLNITTASFAFNTSSSPVGTWASSGQFVVPTTVGPVVVNYTGTSASGFTGCTAAINATAVAASSVTSPLWIPTPIGQAITAASNSGTTVTATVGSTATLSVGQAIGVTGASGGTWSNANGSWTIASIPSATTITFVVSTAPTGTYTASSAVLIPSANYVKTNIGVSLAGGVGFYGATPLTAPQTVTGSKGSNAALTSLMAALANLGLVVNSTT